MSDLQDTLDAIDQLAVHECGHCQRPLRPDGPSQDFCNEACQTAWLGDKRRVEQLIGYREPMDLMYAQFSHTTPAEALAGPGTRVTLADLEAASERFPRERLGHWSEPRRTQRDEAAIERAQTGQWLARFAAPWHPNPATVRAEPPNGRPPSMLHAVRCTRLPPLWTAENESDMFGPTITQDTYRLESVNEHDRSAIYRIQGLAGPRYAVLRATDWQVPDWWMRDDWEGRCVEVEGDARGFRWAHPNGDRLIAEPTERYETRPDGTVAEVWEPRPDRAESAEEFRAAMHRRRIMQEAMLRSPAPLDLQAFRRITGV